MFRTLVISLVIVASLAAFASSRATWTEISELLRWVLPAWLLVEGGTEVVRAVYPKTDPQNLKVTKAIHRAMLPAQPQTPSSDAEE